MDITKQLGDIRNRRRVVKSLLLRLDGSDIEDPDNVDGGPGSGNWGHAGRVGKIGGSAEGGGVHNRQVDKNGNYTSFSKQKKKLAKPHKVTVDTIEEIVDTEEGTIFNVKEQYSGKTKWEKTWVSGSGWMFTSQSTGEALSPADFYDALSDSGAEVRVILPQSANHNYNKLKASKNKLFSKERMENGFDPESALQADDAYREQSGKIWNTLSREQKTALHGYTSSGYAAINRGLRNASQMSAYTQKQVKEITSAIAKSKLKQDAYLYRGIKLDALANCFHLNEASITPENVEKLVGLEGDDKGFMSCGSVKGKGFADKPVIFRIFAPKGTEAIYAEPFSAFGNGGGLDWDGKSEQSSFSGEQETILQRGCKFTCTGAKYNPNRGKYEIDISVTGYLDDKPLT